jgi:hypothetical protein
MEIIEKITGRIVKIQGGFPEAMRACISRNKKLRQSRIGGEWSLNISFHLSPHEYEEALIAFKW